MIDDGTAYMEIKFTIPELENLQRLLDLFSDLTERDKWSKYETAMYDKLYLKIVEVIGESK